MRDGSLRARHPRGWGPVQLGVGVHPVSNQLDVLGPYARSLLFSSARACGRAIARSR